MSFDSDALKKNTKSIFSLNPLESTKAVLNPDPANAFRTGRTSTRKSQERQSLLIERQRQKEELSLAEADSEVARRKALASSGRAGRRSLIKTGESGVLPTTLGGV